MNNTLEGPLFEKITKVDLGTYKSVQHRWIVPIDTRTAICCYIRIYKMLNIPILCVQDKSPYNSLRQRNIYWDFQSIPLYICIKSDHPKNDLSFCMIWPFSDDLSHYRIVPGNPFFFVKIIVGLFCTLQITQCELEADCSENRRRRHRHQPGAPNLFIFQLDFDFKAENLRQLDCFSNPKRL